MSKKRSERKEVVTAMREAMQELDHDPERLRRRLEAIVEAEQRLTEAEIAHEEMKSEYRGKKKKMDAAREELRRVTRCGPDPQTVLPFVQSNDAVDSSVDAETPTDASIEQTEKPSAKKARRPKAAPSKMQRAKGR